MTTDKIRAEYEQLDAIANLFGKQGEASTELYTRVQQSFAALEQGGWEGRGSQAFFSEMQSKIFPAMQGLTHALEEGRAVTLETIRIFQQADEEAGRLFGVEGASSGAGSAGGGMGGGGGGGWGDANNSSLAKTIKEFFDSGKTIFDMSETTAKLGIIFRNFDSTMDNILKLENWKWGPKSLGVGLGLMGVGLTAWANWQDYEGDDNRFRKTVVSTIFDSVLSIGVPIVITAAITGGVVSTAAGGAIVLATAFAVGAVADWADRKYGFRDWAINRLDRGIRRVSNVAEQTERVLHSMVSDLSGLVGL